MNWKTQETEVRTNEGDVVQVWREDQAGEEQKKTGGKTWKTHKIEDLKARYWFLSFQAKCFKYKQYLLSGATW